MKAIDFEVLKVTRSYIIGMTFENGAERVHEYTIDYEGHPLHGMKYRSSTWTPRNKRSQKWGVGKTVYFEDKDTPEFDNAIDCVKDMNQRKSIYL